MGKDRKDTMTLIRQFSKYIALATVAGVCIWALGCGEQGNKAAKQETNGGGQAPSGETSTSKGVKKTEEKSQAGTEIKTRPKTDEQVSEENTNGSEAGSTTPPGGGVETP